MNVLHSSFAAAALSSVVAILASYVSGCLHEQLRHSKECGDAFRDGFHRASHNLVRLVDSPNVDASVSLASNVGGGYGAHGIEWDARARHS